MIRELTGILLLSLLLAGELFSHSGKPKYHVVIDTDGAPDDLRAISMFLSGNDIRVLAITCSQGTLPPDSVAMNVSSLLSDLHHEGILVGKGNGTEEALRVLESTTGNYREKVTLVALG